MADQEKKFVSIGVTYQIGLDCNTANSSRNLKGDTIQKSGIAYFPYAGDMCCT